MSRRCTSRVCDTSVVTIKPPSPVYLGPAAHTSGTGNKPIDRIVIHLTVSRCAVGEARKTAEYFRDPDSGGSAHYVVDPGEVVQCVYDDVIAWHAPPNKGSLGVELCDALVSPAWDRAHARRWNDTPHARMLHRAAGLVARLGLAYDVPLRHLSDLRLASHGRGIVGHAQVSRTFGQSSHWDPGPSFPWDSFMSQVWDHAKTLEE